VVHAHIGLDGYMRHFLRTAMIPLCQLVPVIWMVCNMISDMYVLLVD